MKELNQLVGVEVFDKVYCADATPLSAALQRLKGSSNFRWAA
jgi:hypothetical protein